MTNGQVNCFLTVVEEGSFAKAAGTLFISQPAISKSISKLEEELGVSLLERKVGALQPTPAGAMLYRYLKKSKAEFHNLLNDIHKSIDEPAGTIRLGCPETWNPSKFYDRIMSHFGERYPSVKLVLECQRLPALMSSLQAGKLDILMTHEFHPPVQYGLTVRRLTNTGCGILYSNSFFKDVHDLSDLKDAEFLHFDSDIEKRFGAVVKRICGEYGFVPTLRNCGQFSSAMFNLACGKGVMFFTEWDIAVNNASFNYLPLDYTSPVNIIYPTVTSNPKTHIFAEELLELFADGKESKQD